MQTAQSISALQRVTGNTPRQFLRCDVHYSQFSSKYKKHEKYTWCIELFCSLCSTSWYVCFECFINQRMTKKQQLYRHNKLYHSFVVRIEKHVDANITNKLSVLPAVANVDCNDLLTDTGVESKNQMAPETDETFAIDNNEERDDEISELINVTTTDPSINAGDSTGSATGAAPEIDQLMENDKAVILRTKSNCLMKSSNAKSQSFFDKDRNDHGVAYLVGLAHFGTPTLTEEIPKSDVEFYLKYAVLCKKVGADYRHMLGSLLESHEQIIRNREITSSPVPPFTIRYFPHAPQDMRKSFFKGKSALYENYPIPKINTTDDEHSYCLLSEALVHFFNFGGYVDFPEKINVEYPQSHIFHSRRAQALIEESQVNNSSNDYPLLTLLICDWSDDFDPNYGSMNKGSVFVKTVTILCSDNKSESSLFTFPLILGNKSSDHSHVDEIIMNDIQQLKTNTQEQLFYSKQHKGFIRVDPCILTSLQDQPARRSYTGLANGNGKYSARWGYACDWSSVQDHLPMCLVCHEAIIKYVSEINRPWPIPRCDHCTSWALYDDHVLLKHAKPKDYPNNESDYLSPRRINFEILSKCVDKVHDNLMDGNWTISNAVAFLKSWSFSDKTINEITEKAENCYQLKAVIAEGNSESAYFQHILHDRESNPRNYGKWQVPNSWKRKHGIDEYSNAIMHLMSGIVKSTVKSSYEWIGRKYSVTQFEKMTIKNLHLVGDLGLKWCRLPPCFSEKLVGSLSENNINLARLIGWLYSCVPVLKDEPPFIEPDIEQTKWLMRDNIGWLKARGLHHQGNAAELKARVADYLKQPKVPRLLSDLTGGTLLLVRVMHSLGALCTIIFRKQYEDIRVTYELEAWVRIFLQNFAEMDSELRKVNVTTNSETEQVQQVTKASKGKNASTKKNLLPKWIRSYNFMSLLNLGEEARSIGPPRGHYEGSYRGEKIVSLIKPNISRGLYANWSTHTLTNLWKDYTSKALTTRSELDRREATGESHEHGKMFVVYDSIPDIEYRIGKRSALSGCISESDVYYVATSFERRNDSCKLVRLDFTHGSLDYCGQVYYKIELQYQPFDEMENIKNTNVKDYFILLPLMDNTPVATQDNIEEAYFTIITCEWKNTFMSKTVLGY